MHNKVLELPLTYQFEAINTLELKIATIKAILNKLSQKTSEVQIQLYYEVEKMPAYYDISQDILPFSINTELKVLLEDSLDEYQRQLKGLHTQLK